MSSRDLTVAVVFKTGAPVDISPYQGRYVPECVAAIRNMVAQHLSVAHRFVALTDHPDVKGETIPLLHSWPGWWSKMELFRPGLFPGDVLFFDLDTFIGANIDCLADVPGDFVMLRDFKYPDTAASGVMKWRGDWSAIYEDFKADAENYMNGHRVIFNIGDQAVIKKHVENPAFFQDHTPPGFFRSYKFGGKGPDLASVPVLCFHGRPKPWDGGGWAQDHWQSYAQR